jgi:alpha-tubulin suppressor-like RCC1 family protein
VPVCIEGMEWRQIIACGTSHTIAVAKDGTVHTWGNGESGKLGHGNIEGSYTPKATSLRVYGKDEEISVACGSSHSAILLGDCNLYTWYVNSWIRTWKDLHNN